MIPLIVIALIVGIILGQFLGGALRAALIVGGVFVALSYISNHYGVDVKAWLDEGVKAGRSAFEEQRETRAPAPIKPGLREAHWRRM